jgi:hypothetical protein
LNSQKKIQTTHQFHGTGTRRDMAESSDPAICSLKSQAAQHLYALFISSFRYPIRNPFNIECIIDRKLTVLMSDCAKLQLAHPLQSLSYARPTPGPIARSATCPP